MQPSVAIIILNYNGQGHLEKYLPSVLQATYQNKSIWMVDNNSSDNSCAWLQQHFPEVNVLPVLTNKGFVGGYNYAFDKVNADYILLLNNDVKVAPDFIEPAIAMMEANQKLAAVQSKMLSVRQPGFFDYAGAAGGFIDALGYPFCRGRILETVEPDHGQYNQPSSDLFWATGGCLFVKAAYYRSIQGMYGYLFMQNEDIDLCWRLQLHGFSIGYCHQSVVWHYGGGSLSWEHPDKVFFTFRNNLIVLCRNMPIHQLCWVMPARMVLDSMAAMRYILVGKAAHGFAVWKGIFAFAKWLLVVSRHTRAGEQKWPGKRGFYELKGVMKGSILWRYFIGGKKKYSDLIAQK